jgi:hypothetical protein
MVAAGISTTSHIRLFDLVPITLGRLHTGAVRALLLLGDEIAGPNVRRLMGLPPDQGLHPEELRFEHRINGRKADLAIFGHKRIAVETKVDDAFRWEQFSAYRDGDGSWEPVLFAPMLTGFLVEQNLTKNHGPTWMRPITSMHLLGAVEGADLPPLLLDYVVEIRKFDNLKCAALSCGADPDQMPNHNEAADRSMLQAIWQVAWVLTVKEELLPITAEDWNWDLRTTPHDYGLWWGAPGQGNWLLRLPDGGFVEAFIDVLANRGDAQRSVRIKIAGGTSADKAAAWDLLAGARRDSDDGWRPGRRAFSANTTTAWAWKGASAAEAVEAARLARTWLEDCAEVG